MNTAILDCEGNCLRDGRPVFDDFAARGQLHNPRKIEQAAVHSPATFVAFDVLMTDGTDHTREPLTDRKARLQELIEPRPEIMPTMFVDGAGKGLFETTRARQMEGIVAKRKVSRYQLDTRSDAWLKIKHWQEADVVILGYQVHPMPFALIVGQAGAHSYRPLATVEYGFSSDEKKAFRQIAKQIHTERTKDVQWIEPRLCCRVKYLERTERGSLRQASFKSFILSNEDAV